MANEYRALVAKVDAFVAAITTRREADLTCGVGCASCCQVWLSVSAVEARELRAALAELAPDRRARVRARGLGELDREARGEAEPRCALLDEDGACSVYAARPLVCRTQGHALRYPHGFVRAEAVLRKTASGDVTWCPLNYTSRAPNGEDVLDAERVDQMLALIAHRDALARTAPAGGAHAKAARAAPALAERVPLSALAAELDMLHDEFARHR